MDGKEIHVKAEIITITPEMAKEMLEHNYEDNRNIRKSYVMQLATVMRAGRYMSENGQTIVMGEDDGVLYDGQHRLAAIVESGIPQTMLVVRIVNGKEAYKTIDNGTKRNASDFIRLPNRNNAAAVAKIMACVEWGEAPLLSCLQGKMGNGNALIDRGLVVAYAEQHGSDITDAVRKAGAIRESLGCGSQSLYAFFIMLVQYCGTDAFLEEFIEEFTKNASDNLTVTACKTVIMKAAAARKGDRGLDKKWLLGTLMDAYHHFCEMDGSTMLNHQTQRMTTYAKYVQQRRNETANSDTDKE